jgi:hypothetical protein
VGRWRKSAPNDAAVSIISPQMPYGEFFLGSRLRPAKLLAICTDQTEPLQAWLVYDEVAYRKDIRRSVFVRSGCGNTAIITTGGS